MEPGTKFEDEYKAWVAMCKKMQEVFGITSEEFNSRVDIHILIKYIEQWAWHEKMRYNMSATPLKKEGLFWNGEDLE